MTYTVLVHGYKVFERVKLEIVYSGKKNNTVDWGKDLVNSAFREVTVSNVTLFLPFFFILYQMSCFKFWQEFILSGLALLFICINLNRVHVPSFLMIFPWKGATFFFFFYTPLITQCLCQALLNFSDENGFLHVSNLVFLFYSYRSPERTLSFLWTHLNPL